MNKKLKVTLISISILILALLLIFIMGNNGVKAAKISNGLDITHVRNGYQDKSFINLDSWESGPIQSPIFCQQGVFCVEPGQDIFKDGGLTYKKVSTITINNNSSNFKKGLAYILAQTKTQGLIVSNSTSNWTDHNFDPVQLALWAYLKSGINSGDEIYHNIYGDHNNALYDEVHNENGRIWKDGYANKGDVFYTTAYSIYNKAIEICSGKLKYSCNATIYVLHHDKDTKQKLIVAKSEVEEKTGFDLTIKKIDFLNSNIKLKDAEFTITLKNVDDLGNYSSGSKSGKIIISGAKTNDSGEIELTGIVPNGNENVEITIAEDTPPDGYRILQKDKVIEVNKEGTQYQEDNNGEWKNLSSNKISLDIPNQPLIDLSGNVWLDAQIGDKLVTGPNGIRDEYYKYNEVEKGKGDYNYNSEKKEFEYVGQGKGNYERETISEDFLDGVLVELYNADANGKKTGAPVAHDTTKNGGKYEFKDIPKTNEGYKIIFKYNGVKYNATTTEPGISKGTEPKRLTFNDDFKIISAGESNNVKGLTYTYSNEKSVLNATVQGHTTGTTDAKFQISAETPVYTNTTDNANLGLVERYFDLSIGTDVKSSKLTINDKEIEYNDTQIMNGEMEDLTLDKILQNNSSTSDVKYNLYLYTSDYNYRISDYKMGDEAISNKLNGEDNTVNNYDNLKALEAYVTYSIILKNQSMHEARVDNFEYYYDEVYIPQFKVKDVINGYKVISIDNEENKITFERVGSADEYDLNKDNDWRKEIDLTFKVNGDERGIVAIKENCTNIAEITKYSTNEGGLIDNDSAPGNGVTFENGTPEIGQYEDDTDQARGLKISLKDESRTIIGTVFEDLNKDGVSNDNKPVNDVIVQLIEIKTINGKNREYIWQETRSGSNTVKTTARNGWPGEPYPNSVEPGSGMYEFKDYIPGNYIIRYIYGDGSVYDNYNLSDEEKSNCVKNAKTYNGQDYKSTIDEHYQAEWYNKADYKQDASVARDNAARRLEVMAYSTTVDDVIGKALDEKTSLDKTWMAAETSKLNVPIDSSTTPTEKSTVLYDTMNFGLALRPETKLVLEKHITGLKITPSGTGVQPIVDARADIEQIINDKDNDIKTTGVTTGLATIKSERKERGFWKVETDIEELAQGAQLEVEYTYVIRNDSDEDYLRIDLVEQYSDNPTGYGNWLKGESDNIKGALKGNTHVYGNYLGQYYYTGIKGANDIEVLSRVEELEEALNNQLKYDETVAGEDFVKVNTEGAVSKNIYDTDGNPGTRNIETIVKTTSTSEFLRTVIKDSNSTEKIKWHDKTVEGVNDPVVPNADYSKTLKLTTVLTSFNNGAGYYPSYIAEITKYSNAAGRRNMSAEPANLSYVHSEDTSKTMETEPNEVDEFWGEQIIISKPTGFNKQLAIQIVIITISSISVIGVGIVLIKKFVLKK